MQKFCEFISRKILILRLFLCVHFRFKYQDGQNDLFEICQKHFDTLAAHFFGCKIRGLAKGGDEARSGYIRYVQGKQPNLPCTYFNSSIMQLKCLYANPSCTYQRTSQLCTTSDLFSTAPLTCLKNIENNCLHVAHLPYTKMQQQYSVVLFRISPLGLNQCFG